jgi:hypothetical protein
MTFSELGDVANFVGSSFSLLLTFVAATLGLLLSSLWAFRWKSSKPIGDGATLEDKVRVDEIEEDLRTQESIARWGGVANNLLLIGQVVIGGTLASSFLQEHVEKNIAGGLGVLVLVSSLIHQQFRPDLLRRGARRRAARLDQLLRDVQDAVFAFGERTPQVAEIAVIRRHVSEVLTSIRNSEVEELPGEGGIPKSTSVLKSGPEAPPADKPVSS